MPLTARRRAPGPVIVTESVTVNVPSPGPRMMVPVTPLAKVMVSAPAAALARLMASRNVQSSGLHVPSSWSAIVVTTNAGTALHLDRANVAAVTAAGVGNAGKVCRSR